MILERKVRAHRVQVMLLDAGGSSGGFLLPQLVFVVEFRNQAATLRSGANPRSGAALLQQEIDHGCFQLGRVC